MKAKILIIISSIAVLILLSSVTYIRVKKFYTDKEAVQIYNEGLKPIDDKDNAFRPGAALVFYDSLERAASLSVRQVMIVRFFKAMMLMKLGQEKRVIGILTELAERTKDNPRDKMYIEARKQLALAYLRLGERSNCITSHSSGSCIFPIAGSGVYSDPTASASGISIYQNILQQDSSDLESRWLLNIAYMTIGGYPGKVPSAWLIPGLDKEDSVNSVKAFTDMAGDLQLANDRSQAGGSIVDDFNNDGYLDIVTSSWDLEESMHYFRNNADGTFTDLSRESGLAGIKGGLNITQADYNNDGFTDILVLRGAWMGEFGKQPKTLLRNNGDGTFTDVTVESGLLSLHPTQTATWADFNNDGWLDLFIGHEKVSPTQSIHPSELYINNQDGTFTNVADVAGCEKTGFMKGVTSSDYNNDGWPDIFISCMDGKKILLRNKGQRSKIPSFEDVTHLAGLDKTPTFTFPTWFWDYNNDGWPDIFVCGYEYKKSMAYAVAAEALHRPLPPGTSTAYLYRNNRDGTFTDVSGEVGLDRAVFSMGSNFGDLDNDGWQDMYLGTGNPEFTSLIPNKLFKNIGGQRFADVTSSARVGNLQKGHGVAFADVDNDGDQDIFVRVGGALVGDSYYNSFYVNPGQNSNNWISLQLEGTKSNRSAIGAHIILKFAENGIKRVVYMDINCGGSFGGNPLRKEIGIGRAERIDELVIKWPTSGLEQVFKNVAPRQFLRLREGKDKLEKIDLKRLTFKHINVIDCLPPAAAK